jgi:hypothetical protein
VSHLFAALFWTSLIGFPRSFVFAVYLLYYVLHLNDLLQPTLIDVSPEILYQSDRICLVIFGDQLCQDFWPKVSISLILNGMGMKGHTYTISILRWELESWT